MAETPSEPQNTPPRAPRVWWAWPLRITAQLFPFVYTWKFYGCMRGVCENPPHLERLWGGFVLCLITAASVELLLLVNRLMDEEELRQAADNAESPPDTEPPEPSERAR